MNNLVGLLLALTVSGPLSGAGGLEPRFVGWQASTSPRMCSEAAPLTFMTAKEMQASVIGLTGFFHPAFDSFADVLGKFDQTTGQRTVDRPSLVGALLMQQIGTSIAACVVERELFLSDDERIVFTGIDLAASPSDEQLASFLSDLHQRWTAMVPGSESLAVLKNRFRSVEAATGTPDAYGGVVALLLQHGAVYYY